MPLDPAVMDKSFYPQWQGTTVSSGKWALMHLFKATYGVSSILDIVLGTGGLAGGQDCLHAANLPSEEEEEE